MAIRRPNSPNKKTSSSNGKVPCPVCGTGYSSQGLPAHQRACAKKAETRKAVAEYRNAKWKEISAPSRIPHQRQDAAVHAVVSTSSTSQPYLDHAEEADIDAGPNIDDMENVAPARVLEEGVELDDIRTKPHPHSGKEQETVHFDEYGKRVRSAAVSPPEEAPWKPFFPSRQDFEFAEVALDGSLNRDQCERLIEVVNACARGDGTFNISKFSDLEAMWSRAAERLTPFKECTVPVPYQSEIKEFKMHYRPLWDWAQDLLQEPSLSDHWVWDAEKVFKFDGASWVRFIHEPWTANNWWDIQSKLPPDGKPLCFVLYADKSQLSSFGTAKGYPVIARCANLPTDIRNGKGLGGGRVVGLLPVVPEDSSDGRKPGFVDLKRVVWHESFRAVIESIIDHSKTGCWVRCADGITRRLFPCILILSADFEEQSVMALTRGVGAKCPCPICFVPNDKLSDLSKTHQHRTAAHTKELLDEARSAGTVAQKEITLVKYGLQDINNVFWEVAHSDPHYILSFDRMHAYNAGLFEDHLWPELKKYVEGAGRQAASMLEQQMSLVPRWRDLNHFDNVLKTSFADATKYEDIGKLVIFVSHNVLPQQKRAGWVLLCMIRSFTFLDAYVSFEVHTATTIAAGRKELQHFGALVQEYKTITPYTDKNWDFPKMHWHAHVFDDIEAKGVTRNYNTKPNEKMHGALRKAYLDMTNGKNVDPQLTKIDHRRFVATLIRERIDEVDSIKAEATEREGSDDVLKNTKRFDAQNVVLGSQQRSCTFERVEIDQAEDAAFKDFRARLNRWLNHCARQYGIQRPEDGFKISKDDEIQQYRFLKVFYESLVDWRTAVDYLHCSPMFHGRSRYDCVLVDSVNGNFFARLLWVFTTNINEAPHGLALIQPFDTKIRALSVKDKDLRLLRVHARARAKSEFIFVRSIIRGALLVEDPEKPENFLVVDTIDADTFLRMQGLYPDLYKIP